MRHWVMAALTAAAVTTAGAGGAPAGAGGAPAGAEEAPGARESATAEAEIVDHPQVSGALALLDRWIDAHHAYERVPGISVGIVLDQALIWQKGYGFANVATAARADADTVYSICSISKLFTSIALMQQRDAGRLQLDDPVAEHLPWFDLVQDYEDSGPITIRSLLTHSSGLPREANAVYWNPDYPFPSRQAMIEGLSEQLTLYPASRYFQYSNLALTLAGEIAAAEAGMPYADLVQQRILTPLGLDATLPYLPTEAYGKSMAVGYSALDRAGQRVTEPPFDTAGITPAAGFTSTVNDLAAFAAWQFRLLGPEASEADVLRPSTLREMQRVHWVDPDWKTTWGLGFAVRQVEDETLVSHGGGCPGYTTAFTMMPKHKLAVIVLMNASGVAPDQVAMNVYRTLGPALEKARDEPDAGSAPDFDDYTGLYHNRPWISEVAIVQQGDRLLIAALPSRSASEDLLRLEQEDGDTFRRVREDGDDRGERWVFERDSDDAVTGVRYHGVRLDRVPDPEV